MTTKRCAVLRTLCDAFTARGATTTEWFKAAGVPERTFFHARTWLVREGFASEAGSRYTATASGRYAAANNCQSTANGTAKPGAVGLPVVVNTTGNRHAASPAVNGNGRGNGSTPPTFDQQELDDLLAEVDERAGQREDS